MVIIFSLFKGFETALGDIASSKTDSNNVGSPVFDMEPSRSMLMGLNVFTATEGRGLVLLDLDLTDGVCKGSST